MHTPATNTTTTTRTQKMHTQLPLHFALIIFVCCYDVLFHPMKLFQDAMFEVADHWCDTLKCGEYVSFLREMYLVVFEGRALIQ